MGEQVGVVVVVGLGEAVVRAASAAVVRRSSLCMVFLSFFSFSLRGRSGTLREDGNCLKHSRYQSLE